MQIKHTLIFLLFVCSEYFITYGMTFSALVNKISIVTKRKGVRGKLGIMKVERNLQQGSLALRRTQIVFTVGISSSIMNVNQH